MARQVRCKFCGKQMNINDAYKVVAYGPKSGKPSNLYYCNTEHYQKNQSIKEKSKIDKDKVYSLVCEIIGRKEIINTALYKEWQSWNMVASNEIIYQYLEENKSYLCSAISKLENKEFNRIRYLSAIIKNNIGDYKPRVKEERIIPVISEEHYETKFKVKTRSGFEDLEEEFDE